MITEPNARRAAPAIDPFPLRVSSPTWCPHGDDPYCAQCTPEGTVIRGNRDIESRSWLAGAAKVAA